MAQKPKLFTVLVNIIIPLGGASILRRRSRDICLAILRSVSVRPSLGRGILCVCVCVWGGEREREKKRVVCALCVRDCVVLDACLSFSPLYPFCSLSPLFPFCSLRSFSRHRGSLRFAAFADSFCVLYVLFTLRYYFLLSPHKIFCRVAVKKKIFSSILTEFWKKLNRNLKEFVDDFNGCIFRFTWK